VTDTVHQKNLRERVRTLRNRDNPTVVEVYEVSSVLKLVKKTNVNLLTKIKNVYKVGSEFAEIVLCIFYDKFTPESVIKNGFKLFTPQKVNQKCVNERRIEISEYISNLADQMLEISELKNRRIIDVTDADILTFNNHF
jgi:hypothetical protein